jgi:FkbM family methyltransferase
MRDMVVRCYRAWRELRYRRQPLCEVCCGAYVLQAPVTHVLATLGRHQPLRDLCVGMAAKCITAKYPEATLLDVGANIGDTAAMMATYSGNKIIAIEPSDYYATLLRRNLRQIPNEVVVHEVVVADGTGITGNLRHGSGTAVIKPQEGAGTVASKTLAEVADDRTRFVKLDTDGFDFRIIQAAAEWLVLFKPALLFEDQIRNQHDLHEARQTLHSLVACGYHHFIVWDDPGNLVTVTSDIADLEILNDRLCALWEGDGRKDVCNYDILCLADEDRDVSDCVVQQFPEA